MARIIYKICPRAAWQEVQAAEIYAGSPDDLRDGFIHFSTAEQLRKTAEKFFSGQNDLILLAVNGDDLGAALKWEPSRDGALFPHLYGTMPVNVVMAMWDLEMDETGAHLLPEGLA